MTTIRMQALDKQLAFLRSTAREVGYSGAYGAGKSFALCLKMVMRASVPGAVEALTRKYNVTIKKSTLKTLLKGSGRVPPVLPAGSYKHWKSDQRIEIKGGGEIMYFGLDDPEKYGSFEFTGIGIDEAVELNIDDYRQLRGRLRLDVDDLQRQIYWACNPGPPSHFIAERFGLAPGGKIADGCEVIETRSHDNTFLPADYLADLETFKGLAKARYVDGRWVGSDGLVYDTWDRNTHVIERPRSDFQRFIVGCDDGYTNPAVMVLYGIDADGRMHAISEHYESKLQAEDVAAWADDIARGIEIEAFVVDPSAARLIGLIREKGHTVQAADNAVFDGIGRVQTRLHVAGDGLPRLTVDPSCENLIREHETYEWKKKKPDTPTKDHDHTMDAERYAVSYVDARREPIAIVIGDDDDEKYDTPNDEWMWS